MLCSKGDLVHISSCWISAKKGLVNFFLPVTIVDPDKAQPKEGRRTVKWEETDTQSLGTVAFVQGYPL